MAKLTLSLDERVIDRAKNFAKKSKRSLSDIVETYLNKITQLEGTFQDEELNKIKGIISLDENFDEKKKIRKILTEKYL